MLEAALLFALQIPTQTIYKCSDSNGRPVYTQQPCGKNAESIELKVREPGSDDTSSAVADLTLRSNLRNVGYREERCRSNVEYSIRKPANERISGYRAKIALLERRIALAANNLAGANWEAGMRQEIAGLQTAIATESSTTEQLVAQGFADCARQRAQAEQALQKGGEDAEVEPVEQ